MKLFYLILILSLWVISYNLWSHSAHALSSLESKWVATVRSANVDTDPPARARLLDTTDLRLWLGILPNSDDRNYDEYLVFPDLGIISPLIYTPTTDPRYKDIVEWRNLDVNDFLKQWVHHYPGTSLPWFEGNALIGWHSNFFKNQVTDFTSVFATLPMLDSGDEVWYYKRVNSQSWMRYVYTVTKSYETKPDDATVFDPLGTGSEMTFYTCVPIGTSDNRWIVKTKLHMSQQVFYPIMIESYDNMTWYESLDELSKEQLRLLIQSWASSGEVQAFIDSGNMIESSTLEFNTWDTALYIWWDISTVQQTSWWKSVINWIIWLFS